MNLLEKTYNALLAHYGPQQWWPASSRLEMMISAILVQNTNWNNVELALVNLKPYMQADTLLNLDVSFLQTLIRPAGSFTAKSHAIRDLLSWFKSHDYSFSTLSKIKTDVLRRELCLLRGVGPETADCILLYALERPVFVVDTYLKRLFVSLTLPPFKSYQRYQDYLHQSLPPDTAMYNEYHALIVAYGKDFKQFAHQVDDPLYDLRHPYFSYTDFELETLKKSHPQMAALIERFGKIERPVSPTPVHALVEAVVGQLISTKAANAILRRLKEQFKDLYSLGKASIDDIKEVGLTRAKAETLKLIFTSIDSGLLDFESLNKESNETIINTLTQLKGIGRWTAQMVLIHGYQRKDVASYGDAALRNALKAFFETENLSEIEFTNYMNLFSPNQTLASLYLWKLSSTL